jgi:hypothetical protein
MQVTISRDMRFADIYWSWDPVNPVDTNREQAQTELLSVLQQLAPWLRHTLQKAVRMKHAPELRFHVDRIPELLEASAQQTAKDDLIIRQNRAFYARWGIQTATEEDVGDGDVR